MKALYKSINLIDLKESLLDDEEDVMAEGDEVLFKEWMAKYVTGKYKWMNLKKKGYIKIWGDAIIKNFPDETFPESLKIGFLEGSLIIEKCPKLTSIAGLFEGIVSTKGDFIVSNCPNLTSLEGSPTVVGGTFSCVNNPMLKTLDGAPKYAWVVNIMKNGKRFKEDYIRRFIEVHKKVNCSLEDELSLDESYITETLNEPHLLLLDDQLKKYRGKLKMSFKSIFASSYTNYSVNLNIKWDDVDSTNVREYDTDKKALTICRSIISGQVSGVILTLNHDGEYEMVIGEKCYVRLPNARNEEYTHTMGWTGYYDKQKEKSTELVDYCKNADKLVIILADRDLFTHDLVQQRYQSREGMINPGDEKQYAKIAKENLERYRKILSERKTRKGADELVKIDDRVNDLLMRYMKLTKDLHVRPEKYKNKSWDVREVTELINRQPTRENGFRYGLIAAYSGICTDYTRIVNDENRFSDNEYERKQIERSKEKIKEIASQVDAKLKSFGM